MKYKKEFKKAHPETIGETERFFDLMNYCDWLDSEYNQLQKENEELVNLFNDVSFQLISKGKNQGKVSILRDKTTHELYVVTEYNGDIPLSEVISRENMELTPIGKIRTKNKK